MEQNYVLPDPQDNVAIATRRLAPGDKLVIGSQHITLKHHLLEGHRFAVTTIQPGDHVLSWGLPFGTATRTIQAGDHLCNEKMRAVLQQRLGNLKPNQISQVNFVDLDTFGQRVLPADVEYGLNPRPLSDQRSFMGYFRGINRGWGTRNYLAVIGATSHSRSVVLKAVEQLKEQISPSDDFDGVVPVIHTEGGSQERPLNAELIVKAVAGFAVNPNVGAAVIVNDPSSAIPNSEILSAIHAFPYGANESAVRFVNVPGGIPDSVAEICSVARKIAYRAVNARRCAAPLSALKIAMQCGGSDAFSGISANQVLGEAVHRLVQHGGTAVIAETDELIGSEPYTLQKCGSEEVFERFLATQDRFKQHVKAYGHSAEGNPSGGNLYRGLYNITLKSIGAARKKDPRTALDYVIDYAEPFGEPGFYFMDSPGNDIESVAGEVAAGANLIVFTTGNGSITNFPFVPTIKTVTTTARFRHLASDMDFNAGTVLEGEAIADAGERLFEQAIEVASGARTRGEAAQQSQTQIWRNWQSVAAFTAQDKQAASGSPVVEIQGCRAQVGNRSVGQFNLLLPTSLCSGQVAEQIANRVSAVQTSRPTIALAHTEGCGVSSGASESIFVDTIVGYATHPLIGKTIFIEHGCEKTHNDFFRDKLAARNIQKDRFGWASIQGAGGIESVYAAVAQQLSEERQPNVFSETPLALGILSRHTEGAVHAELVLSITNQLLKDGVSIIFSARDDLLQSSPFVENFGSDKLKTPTLAYAQRMGNAGLHIMDGITSDFTETMTGMGASGISGFLIFVDGLPIQPHRFIPTLQIGPMKADPRAVLDYRYGENLVADTTALLDIITQTRMGNYTPRIRPQTNVGFQITRGYEGVSM